MRFVTYNIKSAELGGLDGLAAVLAPTEADVVGLLEVDRGTVRAQGHDQAAELAARSGLPHAVFAPATPWPGGGEYGVALLSRYPARDVRIWPLYVPEGDAVPASLREPRTLLSATVRHPEEGDVRVLVTHLGLSPEQRTAQAREVAAAVQQAAVWAPVVVLGDLNAAPGDPELVPLFDRLRDAHEHSTPSERVTFPADAPSSGEGIVVDYVLVPPDAVVENATIVRDVAGASDHDLCVADLRFRRPPDLAS